ncbi:MAG TPA: hypothetical protein VFW00_08880 [Rhodocyclaceae bacterium]|nr:hypothetical protein [Rhodocyclaceae bacterium]
MKAEYDLSKMKSRKNPYASKLKKSVAEEAGVPYQSLINLYFRDCVTQHRQVQIARPSKS